MYIAMLSFTTASQDSLRITALICNALVAAAGSWNFLKECKTAKKKVLPLLMCSVPFCVLTSSLTIADPIFYRILALGLLIAGILMLIKIKEQVQPISITKWHFYVLSGAIGALSGITGIGGGVYLAPFLTQRAWGSSKEISATCALFILVNSIAGLATKLIKFQWRFDYDHGFLFLLVLTGGFIGSYHSSRKWRNDRIQKVTGIILIIASLRILLR